MGGDWIATKGVALGDRGEGFLRGIKKKSATICEGIQIG